MERNTSKSVYSIVAAALIALFAVGCASVPSFEPAADNTEVRVGEG
jgi:hypothetical protein